MNLINLSYFFLIMVISILINISYNYEWDSEREAAARFLTGKIFGAVMNYDVQKTLLLKNTLNLSRLRKQNLGRFNKNVLKYKWNGISRKKHINENNGIGHLKTKADSFKYINDNKRKKFGSFKPYTPKKNNTFSEKNKSSNSFFINSISIPKQKLIKVEASPFIRELPFEDHDLEIIAPHIAGIKTLIVNQPLQLKKPNY